MAEKRCVYKCGAWNCGSYQFNLYKDEIDQGDLCDVHYWQTKAQPEQEPDRRVLQAGGTHPAPCAQHCEAKAFEIEIRSLNSRLKQAQPEQEPVAYYHPHKGFYWAKPTHISAPTVVDVLPVPLYVKWKAAQRPWVGLDEDDIRKLYSKDLNYRDGNYVRYAIAIEQALKERNHG